MKFTAVALLAALGMTDAKKTRSLRKPLSNSALARKLNDGNGQFEVTTDYSIYFNSCDSFRVYDEALFENQNDQDNNNNNNNNNNGNNNGNNNAMYSDKTVAELAYEGDIVAEQSYVTFNVLETEYAYYNEGSEENLMIMSLFEWFQAVSNDDQQDADEYCQACEQSYDVCYQNNNNYQNNQYQNNQYQNNQADNNGEQNGENNQGDNNGEQNGENNGENNQGDNNGDQNGENNGGRKLSRREQRNSFKQMVAQKRRLNQQQAAACQIEVDCYTCEANGCFNQDGEDQQQDNAYYCEEDNYYSGCTISEDMVDEFMQDASCRDTNQVWIDGRGEEYNLKAGFVCDPDGYGVQIAIFLDDDCSLIHLGLDFNDLMYGTYTYDLFMAVKEDIQKPYQESMDCLACEFVEMQNQNGDGNQDNQDAGEAQLSGICENIVQESLDVYSCGGAEQNNDQNQQQQQNDDAVDTSWYTVDIVSNDGGEIDEEDVCFFVQNHLDELGSYQVLQSSKNGGGNYFFDYSTGNEGFDFDFPDMAKYIAIVVGVCVVIIAGVLIGQSFAKKDSKKVPLVGNKNGAMA